jgi:hypothetical protein
MSQVIPHHYAQSDAKGRRRTLEDQCKETQLAKLLLPHINKFSLTIITETFSEKSEHCTVAFLMVDHQKTDRYCVLAIVQTENTELREWRAVGTVGPISDSELFTLDQLDQIITAAVARYIHC